MSLYYSTEHVTLYHGDCLTEHREWLSADVLVTDPPYGMSLKSGAGGRFGTCSVAGDGDTALRDSVLEAWYPRPALIFGRWSIPRPALTRALLTWDKFEHVGMGDLSIPWKPNTEEIYVLGSGFVGRRDSSVIRVRAVAGAVGRETGRHRLHPTQKTVALMERLIDKCPPGTIADPFAGSGSTLFAAATSGRKCIGVELDERYCELIAKRLAQGALDFTGGAA